MADSQTSKRNILLIDDDTSLLVTLSDFLRFEGYDVTTADSGERGLEVLKTLTPDLIILDMSMPGMGGVGFLERITSPEGKPEHPVLVLTARANMAEFFAHTQVEGFVAKPCDPGDLLMEVGRIIFLRSGETRTAASRELVPPCRLLLGASDQDEGTGMQAELSEAGYEIETVFKGGDVLEAAIVAKPDVIVLRLELPDMSGDMVLKLLGQIPNTRSIPVVVYGIDAPDAQLEHVAALDEAAAGVVGSARPSDVAETVRAVLAAEAS